MKRFVFPFLIVAIWLLPSMIFAMGCGDDANPALVTLCQVMIFLQGRFGRALAVISIMVAAWEFTSGAAKWQSIATLAVGLGMFWAPKTMALYILPSYVTGLQGEGYDPNVNYTPDEILSCACPDLR